MHCRLSWGIFAIDWWPVKLTCPWVAYRQNCGFPPRNGTRWNSYTGIPLFQEPPLSCIARRLAPVVTNISYSNHCQLYIISCVAMLIFKEHTAPVQVAIQYNWDHRAPSPGRRSTAMVHMISSFNQLINLIQSSHQLSTSYEPSWTIRNNTVKEASNHDHQWYCWWWSCWFWFIADAYGSSSTISTHSWQRFYFHRLPKHLSWPPPPRAKTCLVLGLRIGHNGLKDAQRWLVMARVWWWSEIGSDSWCWMLVWMVNDA